MEYTVLPVADGRPGAFTRPPDGTGTARRGASRELTGRSARRGRSRGRGMMQLNENGRSAGPGWLARRLAPALAALVTLGSMAAAPRRRPCRPATGRLG